MASVPTPHQFVVGEDATATNINTYYSGISFLQNPPAFKLITTSTVTIPNNTFTAVTWNDPVLDSYGGWNSGAPTRYTAQVAGYYFLAGNTGWAPAVDNGHTCVSVIGVNGTQFTETDYLNNTPNNTGFTGGGMFGSTIIFLNVNDYVEYITLQDTGASRTISQGQMIGFWLHI